MRHVILDTVIGTDVDDMLGILDLSYSSWNQRNLLKGTRFSGTGTKEDKEEAFHLYISHHSDNNS